MEVLLQDLKNYFFQTLEFQLEPKFIQNMGDIPLFLQNFYTFYEVSLFNKSYVLVVARENNTTTPALLRQHLNLLQEKLGMPCIYISSSATYYDRKRFIKHRIQFVIVNHQIYLPALGIDWLERCRMSLHSKVISKTISPSTQVVIIYALIHPEKSLFTQLELAKTLKYTSMTITRALNELEAHKLGATNRIGKERHFSFTIDRSLLWEKIKPLMHSPIKKQVWLKLKKEGLEEIKKIGVLAGLSALSELSMLTAPKHPIYAVHTLLWKTLQQSEYIEELPSSEEADLELQIWSYDPNLFVIKGIIDLFSLSLSLKNDKDERINQALTKLIKAIKW